MLAEIQQFNTLEPLGISATFQRLSIKGETLSFIVVISSEQHLSAQDLLLLLSSGNRTWSFSCDSRDIDLICQGDILVNDLSLDISFTLRLQNKESAWSLVKLDPLFLNDAWQWSNYFSGCLSTLPGLNLAKLAKRILGSAEIINRKSPGNKYSRFRKYVTSLDFVVHVARLRHIGHFPAIIGDVDGVVMASKLVLNWNMLLVQEANQRLFVFQGVTSCDAVFIPGKNTLIICCHITKEQIMECLGQLSRAPEFFHISKPRTFCGYLVGHSRPYHCNYDSLLALQRIKEDGELLPSDELFSKSNEAFIDLGAGLALSQKHRCLSKEALNELTETRQGYFMQLGYLFWDGGTTYDPCSLELASHVDESLRYYASTSSFLDRSGALDSLEKCKPLLWVGITGQKRSWIEQVDGTIRILNKLHDIYPNLGVVFDGWTPPLVNSDYHRSESRKDDKVIRDIIKGLDFRKNTCFGILAGLPMLEKIRVGMSTDLFIANYLTGSLNVARICKKPGVGHLSNKKLISKYQHIHSCTSEIDPLLVQDQEDSQMGPGYMDYSVPWQAIYNELIDILAYLPIEASKSLEKLCVPPGP